MNILHFLLIVPVIFVYGGDDDEVVPSAPGAGKCPHGCDGHTDLGAHQGHAEGDTTDLGAGLGKGGAGPGVGGEDPNLIPGKGPGQGVGTEEEGDGLKEKTEEEEGAEDEGTTSDQEVDGDLGEVQETRMETQESDSVDGGSKGATGVPGAKGDVPPKSPTPSKGSRRSSHSEKGDEEEEQEETPGSGDADSEQEDLGVKGPKVSQPDSPVDPSSDPSKVTGTLGQVPGVSHSIPTVGQPHLTGEILTLPTESGLVFPTSWIENFSPDSDTPDSLLTYLGGFLDKSEFEGGKFNIGKSPGVISGKGESKNLLVGAPTRIRRDLGGTDQSLSTSMTTTTTHSDTPQTSVSTDTFPTVGENGHSLGTPTGVLTTTGVPPPAPTIAKVTTTTPPSTTTTSRVDNGTSGSTTTTSTLLNGSISSTGVESGVGITTSTGDLGSTSSTGVEGVVRPHGSATTNGGNGGPRGSTGATAQGSKTMNTGDGSTGVQKGVGGKGPTTTSRADNGAQVPTMTSTGDRGSNGVQKGVGAQVPTIGRAPSVLRGPEVPHGPSPGHSGAREVPEMKLPELRQPKEITDVVAREIVRRISMNKYYQFPELSEINMEDKDEVGGYLVEALKRLVYILLDAKFRVLKDHNQILSDIQSKGFSYHTGDLDVLNGIRFTKKEDSYNLIKGFDSMYYKILMWLNEMKKKDEPEDVIKMLRGMKVLAFSMAQELEKTDAFRNKKYNLEGTDGKDYNYIGAGFTISLLYLRDILEKIEEATKQLGKVTGYTYGPEIVKATRENLRNLPHVKNLAGSEYPKETEKEKKEKMEEIGVIYEQMLRQIHEQQKINESEEEKSTGLTGIPGLDELIEEAMKDDDEEEEEGQLRGDKEKSKAKKGIVERIKSKIHKLTASGVEIKNLMVPMGLIIGTMTL